MKKSTNQLGRRDFLKAIGLATPLMLASPVMVTGCATPKASTARQQKRAHEMAADLVIIGGGMVAVRPRSRRRATGSTSS